MTDQPVMASEFKARCLALLDQVAEQRVTYVVTKHGRPVARVVPLDDAPTSVDGSVEFLTEVEEELFSTGERWSAT